MVSERLQRVLCPAFVAGEELLARLEHVVSDEPGAQVGGRLADVVLIEGVVGDRDLPAEHRVKGRGGRASLEPGDRRQRLLMVLELAQQRRERRDSIGISASAQLGQHPGELAARAPSSSPALPRPLASWAARDHRSPGALRADRLAIDPGRRLARETADATAGPPAGGRPLAANPHRAAVGDRRDPLALRAV
jgi:hypothetical protein